MAIELIEETRAAAAQAEAIAARIVADDARREFKRLVKVLTGLGDRDIQVLSKYFRADPDTPEYERLWQAVREARHGNGGGRGEQILADPV